MDDQYSLEGLQLFIVFPDWMIDINEKTDQGTIANRKKCLAE